MSDAARFSGPEPRSARALIERRKPLEWPGDRDFRILSIDGGGIRGIFPAAVLTELERRYLGGDSVARYFDLFVGTSTGGVIALGLGAGIPASEILQIYVEDGRDIFPPRRRLVGLWQARKIISHMYDRENLEQHLYRHLGSRTLRDSLSRLCIPSCDGTHGDVWVYKTPHHPDYQMDGTRAMVEVALATSAAPTYFRPMEDGGYRLLDGGLWANNPIMVGLIEALTSFTVTRGRIRILSLGCGSAPYKIGSWRMRFGGQLAWRDIIFRAMHYQSLGALGQARLLVGADGVDRIEPVQFSPRIALDDWERASAKLPHAAVAAVDEQGESVLSSYLDHPAEPYCPFDKSRGSAVCDTVTNSYRL